MAIYLSKSHIPVEPKGLLSTKEMTATSKQPLGPPAPPESTPAAAKTLKRGSWFSEEDKRLLELVKDQTNVKWVKVAASLGTRTSKQCRERYHQILKPSLNKFPITQEEGKQIDKLVSIYGKRWAEVARHLPGRSDNSIKNWWNAGANRRRVHAKIRGTSSPPDTKRPAPRDSPAKPVPPPPPPPPYQQQQQQQQQGPQPQMQPQPQPHPPQTWASQPRAESLQLPTIARQEWKTGSTQPLLGRVPVSGPAAELTHVRGPLPLAQAPVQQPPAPPQLLSTHIHPLAGSMPHNTLPPLQYPPERTVRSLSQPVASLAFVAQQSQLRRGSQVGEPLPPIHNAMPPVQVRFKSGFREPEPSCHYTLQMHQPHLRPPKPMLPEPDLWSLSRYSLSSSPSPESRHSSVALSLAGPPRSPILLPPLSQIIPDHAKDSAPVRRLN